MSNDNLDLPFIAVIPYRVQIDPNLSDGCKLYFGQIVAFAKKCGYMWATDDQLAEMKGVSKRSIERWNMELDEAGYIRRETHNVPIKGPDGSFNWERRRKIYFNDAFANGQPPVAPLPSKDNPPSTPGIEPDPEPEKPPESVPVDSAKKGGTIETAKKGGTIETAKKGGININLLDESLKRQCLAPSAVVVSLEKLDLPETLRVKISREYSVPEIDIAVERCLRWKNRPSDECGIMTTLSRADTWGDNPTVEEKIEKNIDFLRSLSKLDGKKIAQTSVTVGNKYIEFSCGMKTIVYSVDDPDFKKLTIDYLEYLNRLNEQQK